jgi:hypothetical protein
MYNFFNQLFDASPNSKREVRNKSFEIGQMAMLMSSNTVSPDIPI